MYVFLYFRLLLYLYVYGAQVHSVSNRSNEHSLRVTSLDHLGTIAARLRRDAAESVDHEHEDLVNILAQVGDYPAIYMYIHIHTCTYILYLSVIEVKRVLI